MADLSLAWHRATAILDTGETLLHVFSAASAEPYPDASLQCSINVPGHLPWNLLPNAAQAAQSLKKLAASNVDNAVHFDSLW